MPRKKGTPVYAERGANPEQVRFDAPEGWTGAGGRIDRAALMAGKPTSAAWLRDVVEAALKAAGV